MYQMDLEPTLDEQIAERWSLKLLPSGAHFFTPDGLTPLNRDAHVSDTVSIGYMLKRVAAGKFVMLDILFDLMTETNCDLRVDSAGDLLTIYRLLTSQRRDVNKKATLDEALLKNVVASRIRVDEVRATLQTAVGAERSASQQTLVMLEMEHQKLNTEFARVLKEFYRVEAEKNFFIAVAQ